MTDMRVLKATALLVMGQLFACPWIAHADKPVPAASSQTEGSDPSRLRVFVPSYADVSDHPGRFSGRQMQLCAFGPPDTDDADEDSDDDPWVTARGAQGFAKDVCLIGALQKNSQSPRRRRQLHEGEWVFQVNQALQRRADALPCLPAGIVSGARVVAYRADREYGRGSQYAFPGKPDSARLVSVVTAVAGPPVIAILSAEQPTIWDFGAVAPGRLRAVILVGEEAAARLPQGAVVRFVAPGANAKADGPCSVESAIVVPDTSPNGLVDLASRVLHMRAETISDPDLGVISLDADARVRPNMSDIRPDEIQSAEPVMRDVVPPQMAGLRRLFEQGAIRNATPADVDAWMAAHHNAGLPKYNLMIYRTYVATRAITVPRDMYGAQSADFLVPPGVPVPVDRGSHNTYYLVATGQCRGVLSCN